VTQGVAVTQANCIPTAPHPRGKLDFSKHSGCVALCANAMFHSAVPEIAPLAVGNVNKCEFGLHPFRMRNMIYIIYAFFQIIVVVVVVIAQIM
jgi:hypothetical protein